MANVILVPQRTSLLGQQLDQVRQVGTEVRFAVNYSALIRAMTSPFVAKAMARGRKARPSLNLA